MSLIRNDALLILRFMVEQGATTGHSLRAGDIKEALGLSDDDFDRADNYVLDSGYMECTFGGLDGLRWVTDKGIDFSEGELQQRITLSLTAERILRTAIDRAKKDPRSEFISGKAIWEQLDITRKEYEETARELADEGFIEDVFQSPDAPFIGIRVTPEGRKALRRGFKLREPFPEVSIGAYFAGPVSDANILAVAQAHQSRIGQVISQNDVGSLRNEIAELVDALVEIVKPELSTEQSAVYADAARQLKQETAERLSDLSTVQRHMALLSFSGDLDGTIELGKKAFILATKVAPLITLLRQAIIQLPQ